MGQGRAGKPVTRCNSLRVATEPVRNSCKSSPALLGPDDTQPLLSTATCSHVRLLLKFVFKS